MQILHADQCKRIFWLFSSLFQIYVSLVVFFSFSGHLVLKRILHSGQCKRIFWLFLSIFQTYLPVVVFFSFNGNIGLKRILHSSQWKLISWLVKNIFCQYVKYIYHFITASGNGFSFQWKQYSFVHIFWKLLLQLQGGKYFFKNLVFVRRNSFL